MTLDKRLRRRPLEMLVPVLSASALLVSAAPAAAQSATRPLRLDLSNQRLQIGPVEGLTSDFRPAPVETAVPLGVAVRFRLRVPQSVPLRWTGATEVWRDAGGSVAELRLDAPGPRTITAHYQGADGRWTEESSRLHPVDTVAFPISLSPIRLAADEIEIDPGDPNRSTMGYYFRRDGVARLSRVAENHFRTSINRWIRFEVDVQPAGFAPLIEWRLDGRPQSHLGAAVQMAVFTARRHAVSAGPEDAEQTVLLDTYMVRLTSHRRGDEIPEGVPVLFEAVTEPPGHEEDITWLASTKYGTAVPFLGQGPSFEVTFSDTAGAQGQWYGVRADHAALAQDSKRPPPPTSVDEDDACSLFEQSAALVEGTVDRIRYTFDERRGPREEITFRGVTVHLGTEPFPPLVVRTLRGPLPDGSFLDPTEQPRFVRGATYLLFLRNTSWFYTPVLEALRVERVASREVLIDQQGFAVNPRPTAAAFTQGEPVNPDSAFATAPLRLRRISEVGLNFDAPFARPSLTPRVDESTVENAHDRASFLALVTAETARCDESFAGRFSPWPDPLRVWDVLDEDLLADPRPVHTDVLCGETDPATGQIRICN